MAWSDVLGQSFAVQLLRAHLAAGRAAPAYLFAGPPGVGKRLLALELAKALNCHQASDEACDRCDACMRIQRGAHPDVHLLTPQGALGLIRIDEARHVLGRIALRPFMGRWQVAIIDGADRMTEEAGNLLLKSVEEPPAHTRFVLLTAQPSACLPTLASRCQRVRCQRLPASAIAKWLIERHACEPASAEAISRLAQGSLEHAEALQEQWPVYQARLKQFGSMDRLGWLSWPVPADRAQLAPWLESTMLWLRDVAVASVGDESLLHHREEAAAIRRHAQRFDPDQCLDAAVRVAELSASLEQLISARLIGTLLREEWIALFPSHEPRVTGHGS